jgi:hypothetical protein
VVGLGQHNRLKHGTRGCAIMRSAPFTSDQKRVVETMVRSLTLETMVRSLTLVFTMQRRR